MIIKAYITTYALSKTGILEMDAEYHGGITQLISVKTRGCETYFHGEGRNWHRTREAALDHAKKMQRKQILALEAKIKRLSALKFE